MQSQLLLTPFYIPIKTWLYSFSVVLLCLVALPSQANQSVLILGDSLSAAYGLQTKQGWTSLLSNKLRATYPNIVMTNASISGETTSGGLARLPQLLKQYHPNIAIIALGANDGLRGLSVQEMKSNLSHMIRLCQEANAKVLLVGMKIPSNYGPKYTQQFSNAYSELANTHKTAYAPFLLDQVAGVPRLNQLDGIHPTAEAQPILLNNVWPYLEPLLSRRR